MLRAMDFVKLFDPTGFAKANVTKAAADYEKVSCLVAMTGWPGRCPGLSMMKRAVQSNIWLTFATSTILGVPVHQIFPSKIEVKETEM